MSFLSPITPLEKQRIDRIRNDVTGTQVCNVNISQVGVTRLAYEEDSGVHDVLEGYLEWYLSGGCNTVTSVEFCCKDNALVDLTCPSLAKLPVIIIDAGHNQLDNVWPGITEVHSLKKIYLNKNRFTEFPELLCSLPKLNSISLQNNSIRFIPEGIGNLAASLETLDLSRNQIEELPAELFSLTNLKNLYLRSNHIHEIPHEISKLKDLNLLLIDQNQLYTLPHAMQALTSLKNLYLKGNDDLPPPLNRNALTTEQCKVLLQRIKKLTIGSLTKGVSNEY